MKFLKNNLKLIIGLIVGAILAGGIVYAAVTASEIDYTTTKNSSVKNVEQALNDLYSKNKKYISGTTEMKKNNNNQGFFSFDVGFIPSTTYIYINKNNTYVQYITCNGINGNVYSIGKNNTGYWNNTSIDLLSFDNGTWTLDGWSDLNWVGATINWVAYQD